MKTLPNRKTPFTAAQYIRECEAKNNRQACAWIEFREACFRVTCYAIASIAISVTLGNLIAALIQLSA